MINRFKRFILMLQIYALDIEIAGQGECLSCVRCPLTLGKIEIARTNARAERARLRTLYNATLPPGQLRIWSVA